MIRKTFTRTMLSEFSRGIHRTCPDLAMVVLKNIFHAPDIVLGIISTFPFIGFASTLFFVPLADNYGRRIHWISGLELFSRICLLALFFQDDLLLFSLFMAFSIGANSLAVPLLTGVWGNNFPAEKRGRLVSWLAMISMTGSIIGSYVFGSFLKTAPDSYSMIFFIFGIVGIMATIIFSKVPSERAINGGSRKFRQSLLDNVKILIEDRLFLSILIIWFLVGFSNLWLIPVRIIYLMDAEYGVQLQPNLVLLMTVIIPMAAQYAGLFVAGKLIDHINFGWYRIVTQTILSVGCIAFFITKNLWVIGFGSALLGFALGFGGLSWGIYVTFIAPPEKIQAYMSLHTTFCGIRGILGPIVSVLMLGFGFSPLTLAFISFTLITFASVGMFRLVDELGTRQAMYHQ
ncbi:MFS transporter [candidate division KSB1 bacterium]|nr:MFS transporter [candidate division KSB1 bacterium]